MSSSISKYKTCSKLLLEVKEVEKRVGGRKIIKKTIGAHLELNFIKCTLQISLKVIIAMRNLRTESGLVNMSVGFSAVAIFINVILTCVTTSQIK
jgi:hypothetical protein